MLEAVLFDVDGTLIVSNEAHARAWSQALSAYGYAVAPARLRDWIGMGGDKILRRIDANLDEHREPGVSILELRQRIFLEEFVQRLHPTDGARDLLVRIGALGVLRAIATSAKNDEFHALVERANVADEIDVATTSDDARRSKPDPDIVNAALEKAACRPERALYVGDTPYDIEAAAAAGVATVAVRSGGWEDARLGGAIAIYDDPADILRNFEASPIGARIARH